MAKKKTYFETGWLKRYQCVEGCCVSWEGSGSTVCADGLEPWLLDGAKRIKVCVSTKKVKDAIWSADPHDWVFEGLGYDYWKDVIDGVYWWVEVDAK